MIDPRYDTQLLIEGNDLDEDMIRDYFLENLPGDCLLVVGDDELIKIHFHPGRDPRYRGGGSGPSGKGPAGLKPRELTACLFSCPGKTLSVTERVES